MRAAAELTLGRRQPVLRRVVDHPEVVERLAGEVEEVVDGQAERHGDAALDALGGLDRLVEVLRPGGAEAGQVGQLVGAVQRRAGDDLGMVGPVLGTAVDRLLQVAGERVGVVEGLGGDADVAAVARRSADGDRLLVLHRHGEEGAQLVEHALLDGAFDAVSGDEQEAELAEHRVDLGGDGRRLAACRDRCPRRRQRRRRPAATAWSRSPSVRAVDVRSM